MINSLLNYLSGLPESVKNIIALLLFLAMMLAIFCVGMGES